MTVNDASGPAHLADTPAVVRARKAQEAAERKHHQAVTAAEAARRTFSRFHNVELTAWMASRRAVVRLRQEMSLALYQYPESLAWFTLLANGRDARCLFCVAGGVRLRQRYIGGRGNVSVIECDRCLFQLRSEFADPTYWIAELSRKGETA